MKYKTFSQWLEEVKTGTTNPAGPTGGPNPVEDAKQEIANKASTAAKSGQDPKKAAEKVINDKLQQAGKPNSGAKIGDVAALAVAAKEISGNMAKKMKK
jgi:hypothetical protein